MNTATTTQKAKRGDLVNFDLDTELCPLCLSKCRKTSAGNFECEAKSHRFIFHKKEQSFVRFTNGKKCNNCRKVSVESFFGIDSKWVTIKCPEHNKPTRPWDFVSQDSLLRSEN